MEEQRQREKDKAAGVVAPAPSYPNKRPRPSASVAMAERAKYAPLGNDFPLEKMVGKIFSRRLMQRRRKQGGISSLGQKIQLLYSYP